jgi:hypothetical protein
MFLFLLSEKFLFAFRKSRLQKLRRYEYIGSSINEDLWKGFCFLSCSYLNSSFFGVAMQEQPGQDFQNRTGQPGQVGLTMYRSAWTEHRGQDNRGRTVETGQPGDRADREDSQNVTAKTGQRGQDRWKVVYGEDSHCWKAITG